MIILVPRTCAQQQLGEGHVTYTSKCRQSLVERLLVELANGLERRPVSGVDLVYECLYAFVPAVSDLSAIYLVDFDSTRGRRLSLGLGCAKALCCGRCNRRAV
jgi:hypothetical protein